MGTGGATAGKAAGAAGVIALSVVAALVFFAPAASASEAQDALDIAGDSLWLLPERLPVPGPSVAGSTEATTFWVWPEGRRAYFLLENHGGVAGGGLGYRTIAAVDLDSYQEVDRAPLRFNGDRGGGGNPAGHGPQSLAVDRATGRLFIAYNRFPARAGSLTAGVDPTVAGAADGGVCLSHGTTTSALTPSAHGCVQGVQVVDGSTLDHVGHIPLRSIAVDGGMLAGTPKLLAMEWSPPRGEGDAGKLHLVVQDYVTSGDPKIVESAGLSNPKGVTQQALTYLVQMDPDSGRQDWALRIDACRGGRHSANSGVEETYWPMAYPAAVFRAPILEDPAVFVACHNGSAMTAQIVKVPLDERSSPASLPIAAGDPGTALAGVAESGDHSGVSSVVGVAQTQSSITGPDRVAQMLADPQSQRFILRVVDADAEVYWVFDATIGQFVGTIGLGLAYGNDLRTSQPGIDRDRGRLYVMKTSDPAQGFTGGLFVTDIRRTPLAQALAFPQFADVAVRAGTKYAGAWSMAVEPSVDDRPPRIFVSEVGSFGSRFEGYGYRVIQDRLPLTTDPVFELGAGRTLDLDEAPGITEASLDGAARGYGARVLLVGGVDAATRLGPVDALGFVYQCNEVLHGGNLGTPCEDYVPLPKRLESPCTASARDVTLGFVGPQGPAVVDAAGSRGGAEPVVVDSSTRADGEAPVSRCANEDWQQIWTRALFGNSPVAEPTVPWLLTDDQAECLSTSENPTSSVGDPVTGRFAASVSCADEEASGYAYARGFEGLGVHIGESLSSFRIYRDPGRGIVSRVESVARGVAVDGAFRIDTVRGTAESWANGRQFTPPELAEGQVYDPNCDGQRTAGTCFVPHLFGVRTPAYSCGPCGDEERLVDALSRAMGTNGSVRLRKPDPVLAHGADNGFIAAVSKPDNERFADLALNNDLLQSVLPTLEVIRYANPSRPLTQGGPRGRQIYQFAGVEVSSSYGIQCLLVYDEEAGTCAEAAVPPGAVTVSLADGGGEPLAGGAFELRADADADGVLGLADELVADGACVTADDGVGTCRFENLQPGSYLVSQVAAPPGYAKAGEPFVVELGSGEDRTVAFTNVSNISTIELKAVDEAGSPLAGASFAAYPDPDSDGKVAPEAAPAATCTTDEQGVCTMQVPAGSYVLVQTAAPGGLEGIAPVPFTFASGGQVAAVTVTNYPPEAAPAAPPPAASPVYSPPVDAAPPMESISDFEPTTPVDVVGPPAPSLPEQLGGTVVQVIRAPGDALRLLARDPKQAVAWTAALALFCLAALAVRRRQAAMALIQG